MKTWECEREQRKVASEDHGFPDKSLFETMDFRTSRFSKPWISGQVAFEDHGFPFKPKVAFRDHGFPVQTKTFVRDKVRKKKMWVGGSFTTYNGNASIGLIKLRSDGSVNTGFNARFAPGSDILCLAVQQDRKLLVGGNFVGGKHLLRLHTDGSLDTGFDLGGTGFDSSVSAIALHQNKILVGGAFALLNGEDVPDCLVRLNPDGSLDTGFNASPPNSGFERSGDAPPVVHSIVIDENNKILVGGIFTDYNTKNVPDSLVRLFADGSIDDFNVGGLGFGGTILSDNVGVVQEVVAQPDGKVIVGGGFFRYNDDGHISSALLRLNSDGSIDPGFNYGPPPPSVYGSRGFFWSFGGGVQTVAFQGENLIVGGLALNRYNEVQPISISVVKLFANGTLDTGFNPFPVPQTRGVGPNYITNSIVTQGDKILVGGDFGSYNGATTISKNLIRLQSNGLLDPSFNVGGLGFNAPVNVVLIDELDPPVPPPVSPLPSFTFPVAQNALASFFSQGVAILVGILVVAGVYFLIVYFR